MDNSFFTFLEKLEVLAFFAGYPLLYALVRTLTGSFQKLISPSLQGLMNKSLPLAYALTATLYLGLQIRNLYPGFSAERIQEFFTGHWLRIWGVTALLFWLPLLRRTPLFSLLHSLVFFFYLGLDLLSAGKDVIRNDMRVYTDSLLINTSCFALVLLIFFSLRYWISRRTQKTDRS